MFGLSRGAVRRLVLDSADQQQESGNENGCIICFGDAGLSDVMTLPVRLFP